MKTVLGVWSLIGLVLIAACDHGHDGPVEPPYELREVFHQYPAWSPDGKAIAFWRQPEELGQGPAGVWLLQLRDSTLTFVIGGDTPRWSPDGRSLAVSLEAQIQVVNLETGEARAVTDFGRNWFPSYSPDGARIAFNLTIPNDSSGIWIAEANGAGDVRRIVSAFDDVISPAWSPDGGGIAFGAWEGTDTGWRVWAVRPDGTDLRRLSDHGPRDRFPAWSPEGSSLAYTAKDGVHILELATRSDRQLAGTERNWLASFQGVSWSPDGRCLVYNKEYLWVIDFDGGNNRQLTGPEGVIRRRPRS